MIFTLLQFPFRFFAFIVGFFFYAMEVSADWLIGARSKTEYIRRGACKRCGRCCRLLALQMPFFIERYESLIRILSWFHRLFFNFQYQGREKNWLIYSCGYLEDKRPSRCRIYPFRHRICRFYPRQRLYGHPKIHPECGFAFVRRDGHLSFDEVLKEKRKNLQI